MVDDNLSLKAITSTVGQIGLVCNGTWHKLTTPESNGVQSQYVNASSTSNVQELPKMHKNGLILVHPF